MIRAVPGEPAALRSAGQDQRMGDVDGDMAGRLDRVAGAAVYEPQLRGLVAAAHSSPEPALPPAASPQRTVTPAQQLAGTADVTATPLLRTVASNEVVADGGGLPASAVACLARINGC